MKCKDCPVAGTDNNKGLCFCAGKPISKINPSGEDECMYGIDNYVTFIQDKIEAWREKLKAAGVNRVAGNNN